MGVDCAVGWDVGLDVVVCEGLVAADPVPADVGAAVDVASVSESPPQAAASNRIKVDTRITIGMV